jgi:hypothetical protein
MGFVEFELFSKTPILKVTQSPLFSLVLQRRYNGTDR